MRRKLFYMSDRDSSLLAESHREFLQTPGASNDVEYTRQRRAEIRKRVREGIRDMEILVEAAAQDRIDLSTVMSPKLDKTEAQKSESDVEAPSAWPLVALLFAWTEGHKATPVKLFSHEEPRGPKSEIEQRIEMFDKVVKTGVRRSLKLESDSIVNEVNNELTISLGANLPEKEDVDLALIPPEITEQMFYTGKITREEYRKISNRRWDLIESGEIDPRPPLAPSPEEMYEKSDVVAYVEQAKQGVNTGTKED
jgi:hypothetical protein